MMKRAEFVGFSRRTDFGAPDPDYEHLLTQARAHESFIDLTSSSPQSVGLPLPHPLKWFDGAPPGYTPDPRGLPSAREALARSYGERKSVDADQFILTASTSEAYSFVLNVLCDPGDRILVPSPSYPLFEQLSQIAGVELVRYRISYDGAFHTDLGSLPTFCQVRTQRIKAIFSVSPNNPTGNSLRKEELERFRSFRLPLVIDEVFRPYAAVQTREDPLCAAEDQDLVILVDGLSKRAAAPGLKLGWMLAAGRRRNEFLERAEWVSDAFLSAGSFVQHALPRILRAEKDLQGQIIERIRACRHMLAEAGLEAVGISQLRTDGGWTALLRLPATLSEESWWEKFSEAGLWLQPGRLYDLEPSPTFALSLLTPPDQLVLALGRLKILAQRHQ